MKFWNVARRLAWRGVLFAAVFYVVLPAIAQRVTLNFNPDWKFVRDDPAGAQEVAFNDGGWMNVSMPHTFNDTDPSDNRSNRGILGESNQFGGRTWYRKTFTLPQSFEGKRIFIEFEAVRQVAEVYINGKLLGTSKTGFVPFGFDLTPYLQFGKANVLAVMCDNRFMKDPPELDASDVAAAQSKFNSDVPDTVEELQADQILWNNPRWLPAYGGIYRNVRLYVLDPLHIALPLYSFLQTAGPYVYATDISAESATVHVEVPIENSRRTGEKVELVAQVLDRNGMAVITMRHEVDVVAGASAKFSLSGSLPKPELWESDYPYLYRVVCALEVNGQRVDTSEIPLGVRTVKWTADKGMFINGHHEKLHGWSQKPTDEWSGLGAAQPDWMHLLTLNLMKEGGGNWVRWEYCAGGPAMIAACNELGLMVEQPGVEGELDTVRAAWKLRTSAFRDAIIYYRNDPSILVWEGGNEKMTREHAAELGACVEAYDPHGGRAYSHRGSDEIGGEFMDVRIGAEGGWEMKKLPVIESGYDREESARRVWDDFSPSTSGYAAAKGRSDHVLTSEQYAVNQMPQYLKKIGMPEHSGGANWNFSDATSGGGAAEASRASGEVDGVRLPKEAYYVCRAMFDARDPQVHIIGHWTYSMGTKKTMFVACNRANVELFVNGKSLGFGKQEPDGPYVFIFKDVAWEPGEIKAVAYSDGKVAATDTLRTAGPAVALRMTPIVNPNGGLRADGSDILLINVEAVDAKGERCPTFQQRVDFETKGAGTWRSGNNIGKTNLISHPYIDLECGVNRVAVQATRMAGKIALKATCRGLKSATLNVKSVPFKTQNGFSTELPVIPLILLPAERPAITAAWHQP